MRDKAATMLINIGFGNMIVASRIVAILTPDSSPIKRLRETAKNTHKLLDATQGRRTRSVIIMDSDHVILSSIQHDTIAQRIENLSSRQPDEDEEAS